MPIRKRINIILILLFICTGCGNGIPLNSDINESSGQTVPRNTLTICLGYEPESLYPYNANSQSAWAVLEAIYDGPIDIVNYEPQPVILTKIPSIKDGDAILTQKLVNAGDPIINVLGEAVPLTTGENILPSGCYQNDCSISWDGTFPLLMDQLEVTYSLRNNISWSDGYPLTMSDSVYSYEIQSNQATPGNKNFISHTLSYQALDDYHIRWIGKPGFLTQDFENYFWLPLPEHAWKNFSANELLTAGDSSRYPIGWGAYVIQEWVPRKFIRLVKNPNYFRTSERLPKYEQLIFKFLNLQGDANIKAIQKGICDFANQTTLMLDQSADLDTLLNYYNKPELQVFFGQGPLIEFMIFNTSLLENSTENLSIVNNLEIRQAIAYCLDRSKINKELFNRLASIPLSYFSTINPFSLNNLDPYQFNLEKGNQILDELGWVDDDQNSATPRVARESLDLDSGEKLVLKLISRNNGWEEKSSLLIQDSLADCGIGVELILLQENDFYNFVNSIPNMDFDLALYSWASGKIPPCYLFSSHTQELLSVGKSKLEINLSNFKHLEFDQLCQASLNPMISKEEQRDFQQKMQMILNSELPFLPLYSYFQADVARQDFCPYELDISARSDLRDIESMDFGDHCSP